VETTRDKAHSKPAAMARYHAGQWPHFGPGLTVGTSITTRSRGRCAGNGLRAGRRSSKARTVVFACAAACSAASTIGQSRCANNDPVRAPAERIVVAHGDMVVARPEIRFDARVRAYAAVVIFGDL
jgi:hypothetical protein